MGTEYTEEGKPSANVEPDLLGALSWDPAQRKEALDGLYRFATREALKQIDWYLRHKESKRRAALAFRVGAIVMIGVAGILPLVAQLFTRNGKPLVQPGWASVAVLVAALLTGLDRFYGFSKSWMRYIETEVRLNHALHCFQLDWERERASWADDPSDEDIQKMIKHAKLFLARVDAAVSQETLSWIADFKTTLTTMEELVQRTTSPQHPS